MKLRLPNKLIAAIMAAASPVLFQTLSTATLSAAATVALVGEQAAAAYEIDAARNCIITGEQAYLGDAWGKQNDATTGNIISTFVLAEGATFTATGAQFGFGGNETEARELEMNAGSKLIAGSDTGIDTDFGWRQIGSVTLNGDATIEVNGNIGMIEAGFGTNTLMLNGHTLHLTRSETATAGSEFRLRNTTIKPGTIDIGSGVRLYTWSDAVLYGSNREKVAENIVKFNVQEGGILDLTGMTTGNYFGHDSDFQSTNAYRFGALVENTTGAGVVKMNGVSIQFGGRSTYDAHFLTFRSNYEFGGNLDLANYSKAGDNGFRWIVGSQGGGSIKVHNSSNNAKLTLKNGQTLVINDGGAVEADKLELGQSSNYAGYLRMNGGSLKIGTTTSYGSSTFIVTGGTLEFTNAEAFGANNSLSVFIDGTADAPVVLKSTETAWTLNHSATIGNVIIETTGENSGITLGATGTTTTYISTVQNGGNLTLQGTLAISGDINAFTAYEGDGLTDGPTGGNTYNDGDKGGFLTSSGAYYMVKSGDNDSCSLTLSNTTNATGLTTQKVGNDLVFWVTEQTNKVYYINADQDYVSAKMAGATDIVVATGKTFSATGLNIRDTSGRTVTLQSGATLQTSGDAVLSQVQIVTMNLNGDATLDTQSDHKIAMISNGYNATTMNLNGHTLTKTGSGAFFLFGTTIDSGIIDVQQGNLGISGNGQGGKNIHAKDTLIKLAQGTKLGFNGNTELSVEGIETDGATATITDTPSIGGGNNASGARNLYLDPEAGKTYTYKGSVLNNINYTLTGAGKQIFDLTEAATLGSIAVQHGSLAFSGSSVATLGGDVVNNSVSNDPTLTFANATIAAGQTRTFSGSGKTSITTLTTANGSTLNNDGQLSIGTATINGTTTLGGSALTLINDLTLAQNSVMKLAEGAMVKIDKDSGQTSIDPTLNAGFSINLAEGSVLDISAKSVSQDRLQKLITNTTGDGTLKLKTWSTAHDSSHNQLQLKGNDFTLGVAHLDITQTFTVNNWDGTGINSLIIGDGKELTVHGDMILQTRAGLDVSGQLTVTGTLGVGYPGNTSYIAGLHISEGAQVKAKSITINNPSSKEVLMEGGTLELTGDSAGHGILSGGTADIRLLGGELKANGHSWDIAREVTLGDITFNTVQSSDTITLNGNVSLDGVITNKGAGTLAINSALINVSAITLGEMGSFSEGDNGLLLGGEVYIIRNEGTAGVAIGSDVAVQVNGYDASIANKGDGSGVVLNNLAEIDNVYFINKGTVTYSDESVGDIAADTVTGLSLTNGTLVLEKTLDKFDRLEISNHNAILSIGNGITQDAAKVTLKDLAAQYGFILTGEGTLNLTGTSADEATANGKLLSLLSSDDSEAGSGHVLISGTADMAGLSGTRLKGTLEITSGGTLNLTTAKSQFIDLSSLTQLKLSGGTIHTQSMLGEVHNLTVTSASTLNFDDYNNFTNSRPTDAIRTHFRGVTELNDTLTIYTEYKSALNFEQLTGNGTLKLTSSDRSDNGVYSVVDSLQGFRGNLTLQGGAATNPVRMTVSTGSGQAVTMHDMTVQTGTLALNLSENMTANDIFITGTSVDQEGNSSAAVTVSTTGDAKLTANKIEMVGGTLELEADTDVTTLKFQSNSSQDASALTIAANKTLHVTGTVTAAPEGGAGGSFELSNWSAANTVNINGNLIVEAGITMEGPGTPTLNINNGGTMTMNAGLFVARRQGSPMATVNVENGGTLELGTVASSISDRNDGYVTVNLKNGATLAGAYANDATEADIQKSMTIAESGATVNLRADAGKTMILNGAFTGNADTATLVIKAGEDVTEADRGTVHLTTATQQLNGVHVDENTLLKLKSSASLSVHELVLGNTTPAAPASDDGIAPAATPAPIVMSDGDLAATIEVTGTQGEHGTLSVGRGGTSVEGVNMEVSGHVDYSAIPGNILNLNGGSLTLSTLNQPSVYLHDDLVAQLNDNIMIEVMTGIGSLTVNDFNLSADQIGNLSAGDMVVVGSASEVFAAMGGGAGSVGGSNAQVIFRADGGNTGTLLVTPEPATAALSLLALAGLAARRRRK